MKKFFEGLGTILMTISLILCFIKTIAYFYKLFKTQGLRNIIAIKWNLVKKQCFIIQHAD
jgi:hypothetical protein